jgi:hypothetical protein
MSTDKKPLNGGEVARLGAVKRAAYCDSPTPCICLAFAEWARCRHWHYEVRDVIRED